MNSSEIDRRLIEYLDGTASPSERAEIESWLGKDAAAAKRRDELKRVFSALASLPQADPPADLRERILHEIRTANRAPVRAPAGARHLLWRRPAFAVGCAFAAGLAAGAIAHEGWRDLLAPRTSSLEMVGAMGGADHAAARPAVASLGPARASARALEEGSACRIVVEIQLPAGYSADLSSPGAASPVAIRRLPGASGQAWIREDGVAWSEGSAGRFDVEFPPGATDPAPLVLTLRSSADSTSVELSAMRAAGR